MDGSEPYSILLRSIPAFAALDARHLQLLYSFCALRVLAKGEAASIAGAGVDELRIIVTGRVAAIDGGAAEAGQGEAIEAEAYFKRRPACATAVALRETVLLTLSWDDLTAAFHAEPPLVAACLSCLWPQTAGGRQGGAKLLRLAVCPAGSQKHLDPGVSEALLKVLEEITDVRVLGRKSFGAGMPGAISLASPETAHWLQEQELEFGLTVTFADETDLDFAKDAIAEADGILFIAENGEPSLSVLERHALDIRGAHACRLAIAAGKGRSRDAAQWVAPRRYRSHQLTDFDSPRAVRLLCEAAIGAGWPVAVASRGVYAAAIFGALQAFEASGKAATYLAAAGSAVLPAGLLACGAEFSAIDAVFYELANPLLWKRAARTEAGLFEPAPLDHFLAQALHGLEIGLAGQPFAAVSRSLTDGAPRVHGEGRLNAAVRAGIVPAGLLPPLILDDGTILVSGEGETDALISAAESLSGLPVWAVSIAPAPLGRSPMSYRSLAGAAQFRLTPPPIDRSVRIDTVLGAALQAGTSVGGPHSFVIPIPEGITPMDWPEWERIRDAAYRWTEAELIARNAASD